MPKTLKNRRNKRSKTQRGGVFGLSGTILTMRSFDKEDFKTVYNYLRDKTEASRFKGFPEDVNNSKKGPPDNILNFNRFKEMYLYFQKLEQAALGDALAADPLGVEELDTKDIDTVAAIVVGFKKIVQKVSEAKKAGTGPAYISPRKENSPAIMMRSFDKEDFKTVYDYLRDNTDASLFKGFPKDVNNSKRGPPDNILNFTRFEEMYLYFKAMDVPYPANGPNAVKRMAWVARAHGVVVGFETIVKQVSEAKKA
jgi:hypothetical protein